MNRFFPNYPSYKVTSPYGYRTINGKTSMHSGIDLVAKTDNGLSAVDNILAHTGGKVFAIGFEPNGAGNYIYIEVAPNVLMAYFHLKTILVSKGQIVNTGSVIGVMGSTGNSTGAHLHFGLKINGQWVDPTEYLEKEYPVYVAPTKDVSTIASEVIAGLWGTGAQRKTLITNAGYNYAEVQKVVDSLMNKTATPTPVTPVAPAKPVLKSNNVIAKEVIAGKWGTGTARKTALTNAGYNYSQVQSLVDKLMKG